MCTTPFSRAKHLPPQNQKEILGPLRTRLTRLLVAVLDRKQGRDEEQGFPVRTKNMVQGRKERAVVVAVVYLRCGKCGWVHFTAAEGGDRCFRCGAAVAELEQVDAPELPAGVTVQAIRWPPR